MMSLLPVFEWLQMTGLGQAINQSTYVFAFIQAGHLLSLAVLGGAVLLVDLRMLGFGLKNQPVAYVARVAQPWLIGGTVMIITTGFLMFMSMAGNRYYWNEAFWLKMYALIAALIITFVIRNRFAFGDPHRAQTGLAKSVAAVSALSWLVVGALGRAIGFI
jgi:hypothetical protein